MADEVDPAAAAERAFQAARERARRAEERFFRGDKNDLAAAHGDYIAALRDEMAAREARDRILARVRAARFEHAEHAGAGQQSQPA